MSKNYEAELLLQDINNQKTNHILHLIMSILTLGLWIIIWVIVDGYNHNKTKKLKEELKALSSREEENTEK